MVKRSLTLGMVDVFIGIGEPKNIQESIYVASSRHYVAASCHHFARVFLACFLVSHLVDD